MFQLKVFQEYEQSFCFTRPPEATWKGLPLKIDSSSISIKTVSALLTMLVMVAKKPVDGSAVL